MKIYLLTLRGIYEKPSPPRNGFPFSRERRIIKSRKVRYLLILLMMIGISETAHAFSEKNLVCIPNINTEYRDFNFQIKSTSGNCSKDEIVYEVKKTEGGIILFLPYDNTSPTTQPSGIPTNPKPGKSTFSNF